MKNECDLGGSPAERNLPARIYGALLSQPVSLHPPFAGAGGGSILCTLLCEDPLKFPFFSPISEHQDPAPLPPLNFSHIRLWGANPFRLASVL